MASVQQTEARNAEPNRWYLAYGSNLSAATFRGRRGICPLAQANVIVPSLELTFDLPGIPYWEPAFANVRWRNVTHSNTEAAGDHQPFSDYMMREEYQARIASQPVLIGVAYLVTPEDFARIIATEGGGVRYKEVDVECWRLTDAKGEGEYGTAVEHVGQVTQGERLLASTLLAPDSKRRTSPMQPSKRYIDILRAGARENDLPANYITYLDSIRYYHITGLRQRIGASLFLAMWLPAILVIFLLNKLFADPKTGRVPSWVTALTDAGFSSMWENYDAVWKKIFGSGEVTGASAVEDPKYRETLEFEVTDPALKEVPYAHLDYYVQ